MRDVLRALRPAQSELSCVAAEIACTAVVDWSLDAMGVKVSVYGVSCSVDEFDSRVDLCRHALPGSSF